jgi:peptidoglycan hydrolase-like protein with peptidoglycan-binding domain
MGAETGSTGGFSLGGDLSAMAAAMGVGDGLVGYGDRGAAVASLQKALGMAPEQQDGIFGRQTQAAVVAFQRENGLSPDGIVGPNTMSALQARSAPAAAPATQPAAPATQPVGPEPTPIAQGDERQAGVAAATSLRDATAGGNLLRAGASGAAVTEVQRLLGFEGAALTGTLDAATVAEVKHFQQDQGLAVDGVIGPSTMSAMLRAGASKAIEGGTIFEPGDVGPGVLALQQALGMGPEGQTGDFGPTTRAALIEFQSKNNIQQTGKVGPTTWEALKQGGAMPGRYLGKFDAYQGGQHLGKIDVVEIDGKKVAAKTARAWQELKAAAAREGVHLRLNSGFRTHGEQQSLYRAYQQGTGNLAAYPGYSNHQHGQAIDVDVVSDAAYDWMHANAPRMGWRRTVPSEPWHWEYFGS